MILSRLRKIKTPNKQKNRQKITTLKPSYHEFVRNRLAEKKIGLLNIKILYLRFRQTENQCRKI